MNRKRNKNLPVNVKIHRKFFVERNVNSVKKVVAAALIIALTLSLCACTDAPAEPEAETQQTEAWQGEGLCYALEEWDAPDSADAAMLCNGVIYYSSYAPPQPFIITDGTRDIYTSENAVLFWTAAEDSLWTLEYTRIDDAYHYILVNVSCTGDVLSQIDVGRLIPDFGGVYGVGYSGGRLYLCYGDKRLAAISTGGALEYVGDVPKALSYSILAAEGETYLSCITESGTELYSLDSASFEHKLLATFSAGRLVADHVRDRLLLVTNEGLYALDSNFNPTPEIVWAECLLYINDSALIIPLDNGKYLVRSADFYRLTPIDPENIKPKTQLRLAALDPSYVLQYTVARFNSTSAEYYVTLHDYSNGGTVDAETAELRLNTDILSGNIPDMICVSSVSPFPYMRKNMLLELSALIEADAELDISDIAIAQALQQNGGIYYFAHSFSFETLLAQYSRFGDADGWTLQQYLQIDSAQPDNVMTIYNLTADSYLRHIVRRAINGAVDWDSGTCSFDSAEFTALLRTAKEIRYTPEDPQNMVYGVGAQIVGSGARVTAAQFVDNVWALKYAEKTAGCKLSAFGWPSPDGSNGSELNLRDPVAILAGSENADGCWAFLKYLLISGESQNLPVYAPALDEQLLSAKSDDSIPTQLTDADIQRFRTLVSAIDNIVLYDESLFAIVEGEYNAYMNSDRTAEETAARIQSKASIYLAEQS